MSIVVGAWTAQTTPAATAPKRFAQNGTRLVAESGIYSDDAETWAYGLTGLGSLGARSIAQGGGTFVVGGQNGDDPLEALAYSTDGGESWTRVALTSTAPTPVIRDVVRRAGYGFVAYEDGGTHAFFSAAGTATWTESALSGAAGGVFCPVAGASAFVALNGDLDGLLRSTDGLAWSAPTLPSFSGTPTFAYSNDSRAGVYADGTFAFLFTDGLGAGVLRSSDEGVTWTITRLSGVTAPLVLAWNGDDAVYLIVESDLTAWATADFATLTAAPSPTSESAITWYGAGAVFVGGRTDGTTAVETATVTVVVPPPTPSAPPTAERRGNRWRVRGPWTIGTTTYEIERRSGPTGSWTPVGDIVPDDPAVPGTGSEGENQGPAGQPGDGDPTGESWTFSDRPPEWKTDFEYRYRECNGAGCGGWSAPAGDPTAGDAAGRTATGDAPRLWRTRGSRADAPSLSTAPLVTLADDRLETLAGDLLETL